MIKLVWMAFQNEDLGMRYRHWVGEHLFWRNRYTAPKVDYLYSFFEPVVWPIPQNMAG